jgi:hypothetical protein
MIIRTSGGAAPAITVVLALAAAGFAPGAQAWAKAAGPMLKATLSGGAEKPTAGDPKGSGSAMLHLDTAKQQVCYDLAVKGIGPATMAHIHQAPADAAGPPVAALKPPGADGKSSGCVAADAALLKGLAENPSGYYVNVHNAQYQGGAVRGQLSK